MTLNELVRPSSSKRRQKKFADISFRLLCFFKSAIVHDTNDALILKRRALEQPDDPIDKMSDRAYCRQRLMQNFTDGSQVISWERSHPIS
jgi:hypothetical protein